MKILRVENEDNAVVCVKIIIDLHRSFRQVLEDQVQPFLEIVQEIFQNMEQTVKDAFDNPDIATVSCVSVMYSVEGESYSRTTVAIVSSIASTHVSSSRHTRDTNQSTGKEHV